MSETTNDESGKEETTRLYALTDDEYWTLSDALTHAQEDAIHSTGRSKFNRTEDTLRSQNRGVESIPLPTYILEQIVDVIERCDEEEITIEELQDELEVDNNTKLEE